MCIRDSSLPLKKILNRERHITDSTKKKSPKELKALHKPLTFRKFSKENTDIPAHDTQDNKVSEWSAACGNTQRTGQPHCIFFTAEDILSAAGTAASPAGLLHLYAGADRAPRQGNPFRMYGALYMEGAGRSCKGDTGEKEVVTGIGSVHYKASWESVYLQYRRACLLYTSRCV